MLLENCLIACYCRYLSRVVLTPFLYEAAEVELDTFEKLLRKAAGAFQAALRIGHTLEQMEAEDIYNIRDEVFEAVGTKFDSRLATHYAFSIASAQEVFCLSYYILDVVVCSCYVIEVSLSVMSIPAAMSVCMPLTTI